MSRFWLAMTHWHSGLTNHKADCMAELTKRPWSIGVLCVKHVYSIDCLFHSGFSFCPRTPSRSPLIFLHPHILLLQLRFPGHPCLLNSISPLWTPTGGTAPPGLTYILSQRPPRWFLTGTFALAHGISVGWTQVVGLMLTLRNFIGDDLKSDRQALTQESESWL